MTPDATAHQSAAEREPSAIGIKRANERAWILSNLDDFPLLVAEDVSFQDAADSERSSVVCDRGVLAVLPRPTLVVAR